MLSENEIEYYSRQLLVDEIGVSGQEKLKKAKVLVVGAGGLGCPVLQYIAAAGVGEIGIIDGDNVDFSNLHRQILFDVKSIGFNKAIVAKERLRLLNPHIVINALPFNLTVQNAVEIFSEYKIIVDCSDNYETRFLVNDACVLLDKPFVYGAIYRFEGQVSVFNYKGGPTYRCLFPEPPSEESTTNCSLSGVLGVLPGMIGVLQASEVIKLITGIGEVISGKIQLFNALNNSTTFFDLKRNSQINNADYQRNGGLKNELYSKSCVTTNTFTLHEISQEEILLQQDQNEFLFLDVREIGEAPVFKNENVIHVPLSEFNEQLENLPRSRNVVVFCKSGMRSKKAIGILQQEYKFENLLNLKNGISTQFIQSWQTKEKQSA